MYKIICIVLTCFLFGCATLKTNETGVCDDPSVLLQSNLCQTAQNQDMQIEDFRDILLDAELAGFISEGVSAQNIIYWCDDALRFLDKIDNGTTYASIFDLLEKDMKSRLIFRIVSRRIEIFKLPQPITAVDKGFLIAAVNDLKAQAEFYKGLK
jgi:hypothetical protein